MFQRTCFLGGLLFNSINCWERKRRRRLADTCLVFHASTYRKRALVGIEMPIFEVRVDGRERIQKFQICRRDRKSWSVERRFATVTHVKYWRFLLSSGEFEVKGRLPQTDNQQEKWNRPTDHESTNNRQPIARFIDVQRQTGYTPLGTSLFGKNQKYSNGFAFSSCLHWSYVHHTSHHDAILIRSRFTHVSITPLSAMQKSVPKHVGAIDTS